MKKVFTITQGQNSVYFSGQKDIVLVDLHLEDENQKMHDEYHAYNAKSGERLWERKAFLDNDYLFLANKLFNCKDLEESDSKTIIEEIDCYTGRSIQVSDILESFTPAFATPNFLYDAYLRRFNLNTFKLELEFAVDSFGVRDISKSFGVGFEKNSRNWSVFDLNTSEKLYDLDSGDSFMDVITDQYLYTQNDECSKILSTKTGKVLYTFNDPLARAYYKDSESIYVLSGKNKVYEWTNNEIVEEIVFDKKRVVFPFNKNTVNYVVTESYINPSKDELFIELYDYNFNKVFEESFKHNDCPYGVDYISNGIIGKKSLTCNFYALPDLKLEHKYMPEKFAN